MALKKDGTGKPAKAVFFPTPAAFRAWLEKHHLTAKELLVGFHTKGSGRPSITWPESVDQALCFGWIDGVRRRIDEESYSIRFTPRRAGSRWSAVNIAKVAELTKGGLMRPMGVEAFARRTAEKSGTYSYEQRHALSLDAEQSKAFRANRTAWTFFEAQPPSYRRLAIFYIVSAKRPETRLKRLNHVIDASANGRRV